MNKNKIGAIAAGIVIIGVIVALMMSITKVPAGYVGIVYNVRQGVTGETLTQGWHFVAPTKRVSIYTVGIEQSYLTASNDGDSPDDDSFEVPTLDGKGLKVDLAYTYHFDQERIADTYVKFKGQSGKEIKNSFIKPNIMSWTKEVTARYPVTEALGEKRNAINVDLSKYIAEKFKPYGIIIDSCSLVNINPDEATRNAIQSKITAQQELEKVKIEKEKAIIEANKKKETAEINAEAMRIEAQAQADANKIMTESLTPELLQKMELEARQKHGWVTIQGASTVVTKE